MHALQSMASQEWRSRGYSNRTIPSGQDMTDITVEELIRRLDRLGARGHIPIDVKAGEVFGLLCTGDTGRVILVSVLTSLLIPESGFSERSSYGILGNLGDVRRRIAIVFQDFLLDPAISARENLDFHARLHGIDGTARKQRIRQVLSRVGLTDAADALVEAYTPDMKRRLEIARSLLHHPTVLLLAEPTSDLEPNSRQRIRDILKRLNRERGMTIIFTTSQVGEAEYLCDRVAVVDDGEIVALDKPETFRAMLRKDAPPFELADGS